MGLMALFAALAVLGGALLAWVLDRRRRARTAGLAASLQESEERFRMLWETTTDAVVVLDGKGIVQYANPALQAVFGYPPREVLGRPIALLQPERLREAHRSGFERHVRTGEKKLDWRSSEVAGLHRSGREFPIEIAFSRLDRDGRPMFAAFIRDITERSRARALLTGQNRALELIASGRPLAEVLQAITRWVEGGFPGMRCTVLLPEETGNAASEDEARGLKACWSMPIFSSGGAVLGTLAVHYGETREPTERELETLRVSASLAGIAIERAHDEARLKLADERLQLVAKATNDLVWDWNLLTGEVWWNNAYMTHYGYRPEEIRPGVESWTDLIHPEDRERVMAGIHAVIDGGGDAWSDEYRFRRRDASYAAVFDRGFVVRDATGRAVRMIGAAMDISERKRAEEQLTQLAQFDTLTGLPNRALLKDRLGQAISRAHREQWCTALLFLDLDRFKEINDTLGHAAGDEVLRELAQRLRACLREGDTVARLGGDEFTAILEDAGSLEQVKMLAGKVLEVFAQPVRVREQDFFVSASIGVAVYPEGGRDVESLLKHADTAMYHAKSEGRNNFQLYAPDMSSRASERMTLEGGLRQALERGELLLHYQPIIDLRSGEAVEAEALLRWRHPTRGVLPPMEFIGIAEQSGLIVPIGEWVLREACRQAAHWRATGLPPVRIAVNLSARQFRKNGLAAVLGECLRAAGLKGDALSLEITESLLMENPEGSRRVLGEMKEMGVRIALDDFGTGYSSLAYLRHFPLDTVKIDRSFVRDLDRNPEDASIVKAMIDLAHNLQLSLTAEGVETQAQLGFLREQGCDHAQGYFFSRPVPADEFFKSL
jgi:diguanylate cyclase (GGDEF)-like protein/PAS domain S-box-containing protein